MNELRERENIEQALKDFQDGALVMNARNLLNTLGYQSELTIDFESSLAEEFISYFDQFGKLNRERALVDEWESIDFLFQLTEEEISGTGKTRIAFKNRQFDDTIMESYVFFAVKLKESHYTRTQLSTITREINKPMPMPAMIIFQHGQTLNLAVIDRRLHKRDEAKDVLQKVTLIKDINSHDPHAAHIQILFDLSRNELFRVHGFSSFVELHRAWAKTLDIQELNKRFYRELSNWYFWAVDSVTFPEDAGENIEIRNATSVIRLITRLIFVWFIKEKKLVPDIFFNPRKIEEILISTDPQESTYYKAILQNLFFATLNQEMNTSEKSDNRKFRGKGRQHYNITSLYRYEECFTDSDEALRHFETIPFLNGGLFECLDKEDKDDPKKILRIDGFSDRTDNPLFVPNFLFFSEEKDVDLNSVYDTKGKRYKVRGLIDILRRYKFTITENTPIEEEVALDPELLGKVFENLLAAYNPETGATARKQTGSFYTPREIVNYMVDESLIAHLKTAPFCRSELQLATSDTEDLPDTIETKLRHLLAYNDEPHQFTDTETEQLINAIDTLKILDPACGSGAFPMGILHKLVFILGKLDPRNDQWRQRQIAKVQNLIDMAEEIDDSTVRRNTIRDLEQEKDNINEAFTRNELDYGRKLYLIENCIYGVDIQPVAVQIAKLRFFISLVVDQRIDDTQENRGVRPLPNLETKFVAGNTLIGVEKPTQLLMRNPEIDRKETELGGVRRKHFTARTPRTKEKYRNLDKQIRADISQLLKEDGFPSETTEKIANWDPYDQNAVADFFDAEWMFGITEGFDVVIGNPPYIESRNSMLSDKQKTAYGKQVISDWKESLPRGSDLLIYFYARSAKFLNESGSGCFITQNAWLNTDYGHKFQRFSLNKFSFLKIIDSSSKFFSDSESQNINTIITVFVRKLVGDIEYGVVDANLIIGGKKVIKASQVMKWGHIFSMPEFYRKILAKMQSEARTSSQISFGQGLNFPLSQLSDDNSDLPIIVKSAQFIAVSADQKIKPELAHKRMDKVPALIMPRGVGSRHYCTFNACRAFSYSHVELYLPKNLWNSDTHYCLWIYLNSSFVWLFREITGRKNLGGGLLKAEATDMKMLPIDFNFDFAADAKTVFANLKNREPMPVAKEIYTEEHLLIDDLVASYFGFQGKVEDIRSALIEQVNFRLTRAKSQK